MASYTNGTVVRCRMLFYSDAAKTTLADPTTARALGRRAYELAETKYSYEAYLGRTRQACDWLLGRPGQPQVAGGVA